MVVYNSVVAKSRQVGIESQSIGEFLCCDNVVVENGIEDSFLNDDSVGDVNVDVDDESE